MEMNGNLASYDNRRLMAAQQAGLDVSDQYPIKGRINTSDSLN